MELKSQDNKLNYRKSERSDSTTSTQWPLL